MQYNSLFFPFVVQLLSQGWLCESHGLQYARLLCSSVSPGVCSDSCPLSQWCHPTISSSIIPFSCLQSFQASRSSPVSQFFTSGGQVLQFQLQHQFFQWIFRIYFLSDWLVGSPCSPKDSWECSLTPHFKSINSLTLSFLYGPALTSMHDYWKNHSFDWRTFVSEAVSLLFNMLSRLVIAFLPRRNRLLISWLQTPSAIILEPRKIKSASVSTVSIITQALCSHVVMSVLLYCIGL